MKYSRQITVLTRSSRLQTSSILKCFCGGGSCDTVTPLTIRTVCRLTCRCIVLWSSDKDGDTTGLVVFEMKAVEAATNEYHSCRRLFWCVVLLLCWLSLLLLSLNVAAVAAANFFVASDSRWSHCILNFLDQSISFNFCSNWNGTDDFVESARCRRCPWLDDRRKNKDRNDKGATRSVKVQYQEARRPFESSGYWYWSCVLSLYISPTFREHMSQDAWTSRGSKVVEKWQKGSMQKLV